MTRKKKYSGIDKKKKREDYLKSRTGDLTSYAALIGDSFASRINLLAQIIRDAHDPSLGRYKERLLMSVISDFIPKKFDVGTGFIVFPRERHFQSDIPFGYDATNRSDHIVSSECDIIVYDASDYPILFKDGDFVVVRPESVRSIVEVKGSLSRKAIKTSIGNFIDLGRKWKQCNEFYRANHEAELNELTLLLMAWQVAIDPNDGPQTDGKRLREKIFEIYSTEVDKNDLESFPILKSASIYNDCIVSSGAHIDSADKISFGFHTEPGKFVRYESDGTHIVGGDRTIASLLATIHWSLGTPFNRFFSYFDQTNRFDLPFHEHRGFTAWLKDDEFELLGLSKKRKMH